MCNEVEIKNVEADSSDDSVVVVLNESFHEFSLNCIHREMVSETGRTGWHNCGHGLKRIPCDMKICPRIVIDE